MQVGARRRTSQVFMTFDEQSWAQAEMPLNQCRPCAGRVETTHHPERSRRNALTDLYLRLRVPRAGLCPFYNGFVRRRTCGAGPHERAPSLASLDGSKWPALTCPNGRLDVSKGST